MTRPRRWIRAIGRRGWILVLLALAWTAAQVVWLTVDERLPDGDEAGNLGAVELFWGFAHQRSAPVVLARAYVEDFGDYPAAYPAALGVLAARLGVKDLDGDAPAVLGLGVSLVTLLATCLLALLSARTDSVRPDLAILGAGGLLLTSPLWSGLQRHLMLENGVATWTTLAAAGVLWVALPGEDGQRRPWLAGAALAGIAAAFALLVKQPAAIALAAIGAASVLLPGPTERRRVALGGLLAVGIALLIAGPWYLPRLAREGSYLTGSAAANPDAMGPIRQVLYYPLVVVQQFWGPLLWIAALAAWIVARGEAPERRRALRFLLTASVLLLLVLVFVPKKYPRLALPALPLLAAAGGVEFARLSARARQGLAAVAAVGWLATMLPVGPLRALGATELGLEAVDERCPQRWVEAPDAEGVDWPTLLAALEQAGGSERELTVGAVRWPVPPCTYRTTHDLGEHLRVRARRAGFEVAVQAGASWEQSRWETGPPEFLLHEGELDCEQWAEACAALGPIEALTRVTVDSPDWQTELVLSRRSRSR